MTDQELADKLVALGIIQDFGHHGVFRYRIQDSDLLTTTEVVRDWRVAGAVMERLPCGKQMRVWMHADSDWARAEVWTNRNEHPSKADRVVGRDNQVCRAIIEAGMVFYHSNACMNWIACEHSQIECGACQFHKALAALDSPTEGNDK